MSDQVKDRLQQKAELLQFDDVDQVVDYVDHDEIKVLAEPCLNCLKISSQQNFCSEKCRFQFIENDIPLDSVNDNNDNNNSTVVNQEQLNKDLLLKLITDICDCKCAICIEILINPVSLGCGHNFCLDCFKAVLKKQSSSLPTKEKTKIQCPTCGFLDLNQIIKPNLLLKSIMEKAGGDFYQTELKYRQLMKKRKFFIDKYVTSPRYIVLRDLVRSILEENPIITYEKLISHLSESSKIIEIKYVLSLLYNEKIFFIHESNLILFSNFQNYLSRISDKISSNELVPLLIAYYSIQDDFIKIVDRKFPNTSTIHAELKNIYSNFDYIDKMIEFDLIEEKMRKQEEMRKQEKMVKEEIVTDNKRKVPKTKSKKKVEVEEAD